MNAPAPAGLPEDPLNVRLRRALQATLQRSLGFRRYLYVFSRYKVATLHRDPLEGDVLHFASMLPRDGVVLDIGANVGIMTVHLARRVEQGHVHAFEPVPDNFATLRRIVAHFRLRNVTLHRMALGDEDTDLEMVMPVQRAVRMQGLSRVVGAGDEGPAAGEGEHYTVPQRRLDDLEVLRDVPIAGIKIDVEGFEPRVFAGGAELIARWKPIVYTELGDEESRRACLEQFGALGYTVGVLEGDRVVPHVPGTHTKHNFFLLPPGHDAAA